METMAQEANRVVDSNGIVSWGGVEYESKDWHGRRVLARRAMDGTGNLVLEDEVSEERTVARPYEPRPYGEFRGTPKTKLARLVEDSDAKGADPYGSPSRPVDVPIPAKTEPAAPLENPLDVSEPILPLEEGLGVFFEHFRLPMSPANHALVEERIGEGMTRRQIVDLAQELTVLGAEAQAR